jgi:hypothetical protein
MRMLLAMNQLIAREQLRLMEANAYPNLKKNAQKSVYRKWNKEGFPQNFEKRDVRNEDLILST